MPGLSLPSPSWGQRQTRHFKGNEVLAGWRDQRDRATPVSTDIEPHAMARRSMMAGSTENVVALVRTAARALPAPLHEGATAARPRVSYATSSLPVSARSP